MIALKKNISLKNPDSISIKQNEIQNLFGQGASPQQGWQGHGHPNPSSKDNLESNKSRFA